MQFRLGPTKEEKCRALVDKGWHKWFAWRPVFSKDCRRWIWLEPVARKFAFVDSYDRIMVEYMPAAEYVRKQLEAKPVEEKVRSPVALASILGHKYKNEQEELVQAEFARLYAKHGSMKRPATK